MRRPKCTAFRCTATELGVSRPNSTICGQPMSGESYIEHDLRRPDNALTRAYGPDGEEYMSAGDLVEGLWR